MASRSASRPSRDWTALTTTRSVSGVTASASRSSGANSTRRSWASHGNSTEVKSSSAHSTREPGSSDAATIPTNCETWWPIATSASATPCSRAHDPRAAPTDAFQSSKPVRPWRHSSNATCIASHAGSGGRP